MRLKIFKKYFITTSLISMSGIVVLIICLSFFIRNFLEDEKKDTLWENCSTVASYAAAMEGSWDFDSRMNIILSVVGNSSDAVYFLADGEGNVISCGCDEWEAGKGCAHSRTAVDQKIMQSAAKNRYYKFGTFSDKAENISYITAIPLKGRIEGAVFGISPSYTMRRLMSNMYQVFAFSVIIPVVVLFAALYIMTLRMTKPMRMMSKAAHSIAQGDFSMRIPVYGDDEIAELSQSFNNMTDSLSRLENMRRSFIGNVSHELKTPMTTIGGFIDGILDGTIEQDKQEQYLRIISDEVKRLSRVVQSMLNLAKLESGEMQLKRDNFDLAQVVFEIAISQERRIEENKIDIRGLNEIENVQINADRDLIYQAVFNLIDNAIKFTPQGGYIDFKVDSGRDGECSLKIRNSGKGIEAKDLPYIFDRFYKTDKSRSDNKESTGLGLYIVKTVVSLHGGTVTVRSVPEQYTEFEIIFRQKTI